MNFKHLLLNATAAALTLSVGSVYAADECQADQCPRGPKAKNIIFMVPDGMGLAYVTATRIFKGGEDGAPLSFETLAEIGYQRTHAANSTVTDSAAAASAWATGLKHNNNVVSWATPSSPVTILELAKAQGKATGLVATSTITHATPAAFGAHVSHRNYEREIGRQYIAATGVDVLLGGGIGGNSSSLPPIPTPSVADIVALAVANGWVHATTETAMNAAVAGGATKILGLFTPAGKTPETYRVDANLGYPADEPTLPEMTAAALDILEEDHDGFFLMVEGSQIDWAGHANDRNYAIGETLAFDEAVQVVMNWVNASPRRTNHTLVVVVGDHDAGGLAVNGPYGVRLGPGGLVTAGWTSTDHTAVDTVIWSQGPQSRRLGKAVDNTDLFDVMVDALGK